MARQVSFLWATYPAAIFATNLFCSEILFTFFLIVLAVMLTRLPEKGGAWKFIASGALTAWLAMLRSVLAPLFISLAAAGLIYFGWRKTARRMGFFAAGLALGLIPWAGRNWRLFHRFIPVATSEGILAGKEYIYNVPLDLRADPEFQRRRRRWDSITDEVERSRQGYALGSYALRKAVLSAPLDVFRGAVRGVGRLFDADSDMLLWSLAGSQAAQGAVVFLAYLGESFYMALMLLAAAGSFSRRFKGLLSAYPLTALAFYVLLMTGLHSLTLTTNRAHFSFMPVAALLAAGGLNALRARIAGIYRGWHKSRPAS